MSGVWSPSGSSESISQTFNTPEDSTQSHDSLPDEAKTVSNSHNMDQKSRLLTVEHGRQSQDSLPGSDDLEDVKLIEPSKSGFYLFILALSVGGLQISWATETSAGTPYLQSLGMSKSLLALVWIAGPLGGVLVQPYIGIRSDNCRISWGKRKPFMVGGAIATAVSFLCLSWAREIVHGTLGVFGADSTSQGVVTSTIVFATIWVYILDFAINAVQAGIRAFIVDNAPFHQQEDANAWAGRLTGVGNILGYICGYIHLPSYFPWLGRTQIQILCAIAAIMLCSTVLVSAVYVRERDPRLEGPPTPNPGLWKFFSETFQAAVRMPEQIRKICVAQFFNWLGWFGFLFYVTTYIGQLKLNPYFVDHPDLTDEEIEHKWEDATRYATFALLIFAIVSFAASIILPFIVTRTYSISRTELMAQPSSNSIHRHEERIPTMSTRLADLLSRAQIPWLTLRRAWFLSHLLFALLMLATFLVGTYVGATILTAFVGIPWALTLWAPFALISAEISKRDTEARLRVGAADGEEAVGEQHDQAGVILGLHNVAVSAPQILATIVSSVIFKVFQKPRGEPYDTSVAWVLRFGGLAALAAAYCTYRVNEEGETLQGHGVDGRYERVDNTEMA